MSLQATQAGFMACLHDADHAPPPDFDARMQRGLAVYRNNYQTTLLDTLRSTFEHTRAWVGEEAFSAAAAHHCVLSPPSGWTLDDVGDGFAQTLSVLFAQDPEVTDLAALEWAMHRAFAAADAAGFDIAAFQQATVGYREDDWAGLRLLPQPALQVLAVRTDCVALWRALAEGDLPANPPLLPQAQAVIVWREGWRPLCRLVSAEEGDALRAVAAGQDYGALCEQLTARHGADQAAVRAGQMLAGWLQGGLLCGIGRAAP